MASFVSYYHVLSLYGNGLGMPAVFKISEIIECSPHLIRLEYTKPLSYLILTVSPTMTFVTMVLLP